jgi:hypothetical protein
VECYVHDVDIRKQWKRLLAIAAEMLGYELTGKKAKFLNFRHTGASHIAQRGRDPRHLLAVVKMMGDTSVATVEYFRFAGPCRSTPRPPPSEAGGRRYLERRVALTASYEPSVRDSFVPHSRDTRKSS